MHIEKNICESIIGTLMDIQGKSKDSDKARLDMEALGIKPELHHLRVGDDTFIPPACHGPKPSSSISGASSRERLMNELGESRRRAVEAELNYEEARNQVIEAQKRTDELQERVKLLESQQAESIGSLSSQIAFLQKQFSMSRSSSNSGDGQT